MRESASVSSSADNLKELNPVLDGMISEMGSRFGAAKNEAYIRLMDEIAGSENRITVEKRR